LEKFGFFGWWLVVSFPVSFPNIGGRLHQLNVADFIPFEVVNAVNVKLSGGSSDKLEIVGLVTEDPELFLGQVERDVPLFGRQFQKVEIVGPRVFDPVFSVDANGAIFPAFPGFVVASVVFANLPGEKIFFNRGEKIPPREGWFFGNAGKWHGLPIGAGFKFYRVHIIWGLNAPFD